MGLFDKLKAEFIDIIEWLDDTRQTLVWRFPRYHNQIKNGAQLIVRPGQLAVFVHQGKLADIFEPGQYTLETENLPVLSTLQGWKYGFDSPFKAEVYFVATTQIVNLKWGTPQPIMMRDPDFGPIRIRAFGTYAVQAKEPKILLQELVGTDSALDVNEVSELFRSMIINSFAELIAESKIPALDLAQSYPELSEQLLTTVQEQIDDEYGLELPQLFIVNISLPEEVEKAIDAKTSMNLIGNMQNFQQYQMGKSMPDAAQNPGAGGMAAGGMAMGMGYAMANQMAPAMGGAAQPSAPPPPPMSAWFISVQGQSTGPFDMTRLSQEANAGRLSKGSMVWSQALGNWKPAGEVPELSELFNSPPPPPPPPPPSS